MQTWLATLVAIAGGLGTGLGLAVWLGKREIGRVLAVVDRMPEKAWFERVETKLDRLDPERVAEHHQLVRQHDARLENHEGRMEHVERDVADHELRIRGLESRRPA